MPNQKSDQRRDDQHIDRGVLAVSKNQYPAVKKAGWWSLVAGVTVAVATQDWGAVGAVVAAINLYAICHLLQSIHDFLKDLHGRMEGGYPPA